jgi:hypothetical protein
MQSPTTGIACCARAVSGHAAAAPPSSVMNSRRFTPVSPVRDFSPVYARFGSIFVRLARSRPSRRVRIATSRQPCKHRRRGKAFRPEQEA